MIDGKLISEDQQRPYLQPIARYQRLYDKIHLISNNGTFGTVFRIQHKESGECFAARHVRAGDSRSALRDECAILWQIRNIPELIQMHGLYEAQWIILPFSCAFQDENDHI